MVFDVYILNDAHGEPINRSPIIVLGAEVVTDSDFAIIERFVTSKGHDGPLWPATLRLYLPHIVIMGGLGPIQIIGHGVGATRRVEWMLHPPGTIK